MIATQLERLKEVPGLKGVPDEQLQWLLNEGTTVEFAEGDLLFNVGDPIDKTYIILEGKVRMSAVQSGKLKQVAEFEANSITGFLPFSRATNSFGIGACVKKTVIFKCTAAKIKEAVKNHYELTEALVHAMTSRVRDFTSSVQQDEKMFALGKLSAGLAHELNNPAAAISRSAAALKNTVISLPSQFKDIAALTIEPDQIDLINNLFYKKISGNSTRILSMLERADQEDDITDWLMDYGVEETDIAENMVDMGICVKDLEELSGFISPEQMPTVLNWINSYLLTGKLATDICEASKRISDLINSVKNFTHMDQDADKRSFDIHAGIKNTLTILDHKLKKGKVKVNENFDLSIPMVNAFPGELNQVWTNIIDNAIDAMEVNESGVLEIRTYEDSGNVYVSIKDNGPGIPSAIQSQVYDPFFTTKEMGKGTGLGLDVVNRIIRQHNGSIKLSSAPGQTEFLICLPLGND